MSGEFDAQAQASSNVSILLSPLLQAYTESMQAAQASQASLQSNLKSVLAALQSAQSEYKESNTTMMYEYAARVESLRKRLEGVAYTMKRVALRLESLQGVVTKVELQNVAEEKRLREVKEAHKEASPTPNAQ